MDQQPIVVDPTWPPVAVPPSAQPHQAVMDELSKLEAAYALAQQASQDANAKAAASVQAQHDAADAQKRSQDAMTNLQAVVSETVQLIQTTYLPSK